MKYELKFSEPRYSYASQLASVKLVGIEFYANGDGDALDIARNEFADQVAQHEIVELWPEDGRAPILVKRNLN